MCSARALSCVDRCGRKKTEIPSRIPSSLRPFIRCKYEATAQMFFEQSEWVRVSADKEEQAAKADEQAADSSDDEGGAWGHTELGGQGED